MTRARLTTQMLRSDVVNRIRRNRFHPCQLLAILVFRDESSRERTLCISNDVLPIVRLRVTFQSSKVEDGSSAKQVTNRKL